jgi:flagellar biosynthesis protein FliR
VLRPQQGYWTIAVLALSSILIGLGTGFTLPLILSGHLLAGWMINGGPKCNITFVEH